MKQLIPALLAALCLLLASCGTSPAATLPMGTDETPVESEASESTGPWAPTGEQMQKENAVTDLLNESGEGYSYRIPQLNCQTQDAELINTAISDELMPLVDEAHTAQAQGYGPTCVEIGWEFVRSTMPPYNLPACMALNERRYRRNRCVPFYRWPVRVGSSAPGGACPAPTDF